MPCIYLIRLNGVPKYIGYTKTTLNERWIKHLSAARTGFPQLLYKAIRKYGEESFTIESLMIHDNHEYLRDVMEPQYIAEYQTHVKMGKGGYNLTDGGEGCLGWIPSEETKRKISEAKTGEIRSEEARKRISESKKGQPSGFKGKSQSPEARLKMSLAKKGKPSPKKGKQGKPHSPETRLKMSLAHKKRLESQSNGQD